MNAVPLLLLHGVLTADAAPATTAAKPGSILVMSIAPTTGVSPELTRQLTVYLVDEGSRVTPSRLVALEEVQGAMSAEQLRQVSGCDSVSCAVEIAGALATDEVVFGTLGKVGESYLWTMSRVRTRDAQVLARATERVDKAPLETLLDRVPRVAQRLFGSEHALPVDAPVAKVDAPPPVPPAPPPAPRYRGPDPAPPLAPPAVAPPAPPPAPPRAPVAEGTSLRRPVLTGAGITAAAGTAVLLLVALVATATWGGIVALDVSRGGTFTAHQVNTWQGLAGDVALGGATVVGAGAVLLGLAAVVAVVVAWMP